MGVSGRHLSVACLRRRAWMLVFSSAEMTNSSSFKALPSHSRAHKSSIRPELGIAGEAPTTVIPGRDGVFMQPAPQRTAADGRHQAAVLDLLNQILSAPTR